MSRLKTTTYEGWCSLTHQHDDGAPLFELTRDGVEAEWVELTHSPLVWEDVESRYVLATPRADYDSGVYSIFAFRNDDDLPLAPSEIQFLEDWIDSLPHDSVWQRILRAWPSKEA